MTLFSEVVHIILQEEIDALISSSAQRDVYVQGRNKDLSKDKRESLMSLKRNLENAYKEKENDLEKKTHIYKILTDANQTINNQSTSASARTGTTESSLTMLKDFLNNFFDKLEQLKLSDITSSIDEDKTFKYYGLIAQYHAVNIIQKEKFNHRLNGFFDWNSYASYIPIYNVFILDVDKLIKTQLAEMQAMFACLSHAPEEEAKQVKQVKQQYSEDKWIILEAKYKELKSDSRFRGIQSFVLRNDLETLFTAAKAEKPKTDESKMEVEEEIATSSAKSLKKSSGGKK